MADRFSEQFIKALETNDRETLVAIPKSDLHNHIGRGCRKQWLSQKLNHEFADHLLVFNSTIDEEYLRLYEAGTLTAKQLDEIRLWGIGEKNGINN